MPPDSPAVPPRTEIVLRRIDQVVEAGRTPATWDLKDDSDVVVGASEACAIRLEGVGAAPKVARLRVVPEKADKRLLGTVREPAFVRFTPFWCDGEEVCREDPDAEAALEFGNTIEIGSAVLRLERPPPKAPRTLMEKLDAWADRLIEGRNPDLRSRVQAARIFGSISRRRQLERHLATVIHPRESAAARSMVKRSRTTTEVAVPLMLGACALAVLATARGWVDAGTAAVTLLVTAIALILVCGGLFLAPIGGIVATMMGLTVIELLVPPEEAATGLAVLMIPTAWLVGRTLSFVGSPLPSEKRGEEAPLALVIVFWPALQHWWVPDSPFEVRTWGWVGMVLIGVWAFVAIPLLRRRSAGESTILDRLPKPLKRFVPAAISKDVSVLVEVVWYRSRRRFATRLGAVLLSIAPVLAILNSTDLREAVRLPESLPSDSTVLLLGSLGSLTESAEFGTLLQPTDSSVLGDGDFERTAVLPATSLSDFDYVASSTLTELEDLARTLFDGDPITVWSIEPREGGLVEEVDVTAYPLWATTPTRLEELESVAWWTGPAMLALILLGVAVLWGAYRQGAVAIAAGVLLIASSYFLVLTSQPRFSWLPISLFPVSDLVVMAARTEWETLASASFLIMAFPAALLGLIAPVGLLQGTVIAEWLISQDGIFGESMARRVALRLALPAVMIAVLVPLARWEWAFLVLAVVAALAYKAVLFLYHSEGTADWGHWALLSSTFFIPWATLTLDAASSPWSRLVVVVFTLVLVVSSVRVFVVQNTWGLGPAMAYLGTAWLLPLAFFGAEDRISALLEQYRVVPPTVAGVTALFILGLLLRPVFLRVRRLFERMRRVGVSEVLEHLTRAVDELLKRSTPDRRIETVRSLLSDARDGLGLRTYGLYSRRGSESGAFECLVNGFDEGFRPPSLVLSHQLLEDLVAMRRGFVDVEAAADDERFSLTAPELWRLRRRMSHCAEEVRDRCRYAMPFHIGGHVFGLLVVAELDERIAQEPLMDRLRAVGLAAS